MQRAQFSQSLLLSNLEAIKNNLEKSDSGLRMRHENKVADLTEQCCRLKAKIESNMDLKEAQSKYVVHFLVSFFGGGAVAIVKVKRWLYLMTVF